MRFQSSDFGVVAYGPNAHICPYFGLPFRVQLSRAGNGCHSPRYRGAGKLKGCEAKIRHA